MNQINETICNLLVYELNNILLRIKKWEQLQNQLKLTLTSTSSITYYVRSQKNLIVYPLQCFIHVFFNIFHNKLVTTFLVTDNKIYDLFSNKIYQ